MVDEHSGALAHSKHGIGLYLGIRWENPLGEARYDRLGQREVLLR